MMRIIIPAGLLEGRSLHFPRTTVVVLSGAGAVAKANPAWLAAALHGAGGLPTGSIEELYRFENPTRWFFTASDKMSKTVFDSLHGKRVAVPGTNISLHLEHADKERTRLTLHWLPQTYPVEAVKVVVAELTGDSQAEIFKLRNQEGRWAALCRPVRPVPHYASVEVPGREDTWHTIKITLPGRLTECQWCGETSHWSNRCPDRTRNKKEKHTEISTTDFPYLTQFGESVARTLTPKAVKPQTPVKVVQGRDQQARTELPLVGASREGREMGVREGVGISQTEGKAAKLHDIRRKGGKKVSEKAVDHEAPDEGLTHSEVEESQEIAPTQTGGRTRRCGKGGTERRKYKE